jgi:hypothetical protein
MSKNVSDSVNKYLRENKKPFTGEIVSHEEIAIINQREPLVLMHPSGGEDIVSVGHFMYESPIKLDMEKVVRMETCDPRYRKRSVPRRLPLAKQAKLPLS